MKRSWQRSWVAVIEIMPIDQVKAVTFRLSNLKNVSGSEEKGPSKGLSKLGEGASELRRRVLQTLQRLDSVSVLGEGTKELASPRVNGYLMKSLCSKQAVSTQTDCIQDTAQKMKLKRLKASIATMTRQTDAEQGRPTIKKLEVKQVEFKLGEDCWEIQV
ncbi:hypothetical protein Tco_1293196 [Tanacetum coccineum]